MTDQRKPPRTCGCPAQRQAGTPVDEREGGRHYPCPLRQRKGGGLRCRTRPSQAVLAVLELDLVYHRNGPSHRNLLRLVDGLEQEIGYFDLTELAETTVFGGVPAVERDLYWEPKTLGEIKR